MSFLSKLLGSAAKGAVNAAQRSLSSTVNNSVRKATGGRVRVSLNLVKKPPGRKR